MGKPGRTAPATRECRENDVLIASEGCEIAVFRLGAIKAPGVRPQSTSGHLFVAFKKLQGMLLSVPAAGRSIGQSLNRPGSAITVAAIRQLLGNFGRVVGDCSFVRAFSRWTYETRAIVGRQMGGCWLATGRFLGGNHTAGAGIVGAWPLYRTSHNAYYVRQAWCAPGPLAPLALCASVGVARPYLPDQSKSRLAKNAATAAT